MSSTDHRLLWSALASTAAAALVLTGCGDDEAAEPESSAEPTTAQTAAEAGPNNPENNDDEAPGPQDSGPFASAEIVDVAGNPLGRVTFTELETTDAENTESEDAEGANQVRVDAQVEDLPPGFRGLSVHETGLCEPESTNEWGSVGDFYSAGGHLPGTREEQEVVEGEDQLQESEGVEGEPGAQGEQGEQWHSIEGEVPGTEGEDGSEILHPDFAGTLPNVLVNEDGTGQLSVVTDRLSQELLLDDDGSAVILHSAPDHHGNIPPRYAPNGLDYESQVTGDSGARTACGVVESES